MSLLETTSLTVYLKVNCHYIIPTVRKGKQTKADVKRRAIVSLNDVFIGVL